MDSGLAPSYVVYSQRGNLRPLVGRLIAAWMLRSARRSDKCAAINGLVAEILYEHYLCDLLHLDPVTYTIVCDQTKRLDEALREGWTDPVDGTKCDRPAQVHKFPMS